MRDTFIGLVFSSSLIIGSLPAMANPAQGNSKQENPKQGRVECSVGTVTDGQATIGLPRLRKACNYFKADGQLVKTVISEKRSVSDPWQVVREVFAQPTKQPTK